MKVAAYVRVSTDQQADAGMGLHIQRDTIARWARNGGHTVGLWCEDVGQSGSNGLESRAGLMRAIDAVRVRRVRGIVVARLDRLARDLVLQEQLLAEVRRAKGRVFSCSPGEDAYLEDDPGDPSRRLIRQILGAVAEYERAMIRLRLTAGKNRKREEGGWLGGAPPYGWRIVDSELVQAEEEQAQIDLMRVARAGGASYRAIARLLNEAGVPPPRGGARWYENSVRRILERTERTGRVL
jgi:DNA invertase Pin-like site-specific DNA recombinase